MSDTYDRAELGACFKETRSKIACDFVYIVMFQNVPEIVMLFLTVKQIMVLL